MDKKAYNATYRAAHPEEKKAYAAAYYAANQERTRPPHVPGESAFARKLRLNQIWQSAHKCEREAYRERCRVETAEIRRQFAVPPVRPTRRKADQ